jgi:hypothetical protein
MSRAGRLAAPLFLLAPLLAAGPARADSPAEAADALQQQIRAWVADLAGPAVDFGSHAVTVTPDGEGFRFELPLAGPVGSKGLRIAGDPVTATAKPLDGGRWAIQSLTLPSPLSLEWRPAPDASGPRWTMQMAEQQASGVFDPSLATGSSFDMTVRGYSSFRHSERGTQSTTLYHYAGHAGWQPAGEGRVDAAGSGEAENLVVSAAQPSGRKVTFTAASARSSWRLQRVSFERLGAAVRSIGRLLPSAMRAADKAAAPDSLTPEDRARLHDLVLALSFLLDGMEQQVTLEKVRLEAGGIRGTLDRLSLGEQAAAPGGMLDASLHLSMQGIDSPQIPDALRDYVPRRLAFTPHISGVPAHDLIDLLLRAIESEHPEAVLQEASGLLGKGPLKAGVDDVALDLGPATLKGKGTMSIAAPDDIKGNAQLAATGLDALIGRAGKVPALQGSVPFLILLKGIGEQHGDEVVWNISYADGHTTVNGTDLATLMPAAKPRPARPHRP